MTKQKIKIIEEIFKESSNIYHNIRIDFDKMPKEDFDWGSVADYTLEDFVNDFETLKINDSGNRNLCGCNKVICTEKDSFNFTGACEKHDLYHIHQDHKTLYWDKYWRNYNQFRYEAYQLTELETSELKIMLREIKYFKKAVSGLMDNFYENCKIRVKELVEEKQEEQRLGKLYTKILKAIIDNGFKKRIINDLI